MDVILYNIHYSGDYPILIGIIWDIMKIYFIIINNRLEHSSKAHKKDDQRVAIFAIMMKYVFIKNNFIWRIG